MTVAKGVTLPRRVTVSTRTVKDQPTAKVIDDLINALNDALGIKVDSTTPFVPLLTSPSGYIFSLQVDDSGNLSTTLVRKST